MASTVTTAAVSNKFEAYSDAAVREPVIIANNGRPRTVLLAYEDYLRLSPQSRSPRWSRASIISIPS